MASRLSKRKPRGGGLSYFGPQESPSLAHRKKRLLRISVLVAYVVMVAAITEIPTFRDRSGEYDVDSELYASRTIQADFALESEDLEATREKREQQAAQVAATFRVDMERVSNQLRTTRQQIFSLVERREQVDGAIRS